MYLSPSRRPLMFPTETPKLTYGHHSHVTCHCIGQIHAPPTGSVLLRTPWCVPHLSVVLDLRTPAVFPVLMQLISPCPAVISDTTACPWDAPFHLPSFTFPQPSRLGNQEVLRASDSRDAERGADRVPLAMGGGGGVSAEGQGSCKRGTTAVLSRDLKSLRSENRVPYTHVQPDWRWE